MKNRDFTANLIFTFLFSIFNSQAMKTLLTIAFSIAILTLPVYSQSVQVSLRPVCKLPSILDETSGLEITEGYTFWSQNDSGGEPEIYMFDSSGTYYRSMRLANASNVDWEELAQDSDGNFYIGDFGNNNNNRTDLRIYKIPNPLPMSTDRTNAEIIEFSYTDQKAFPPAGPMLHYDMEAMFWHAGALYLFSKNRSKPYDGMVYVYKIPDTPGTYTVARIDSFDTGGDNALTSSVTAADISPDGSMLALLSYGKMWIMSGFTGDAFFSGNVQQFDFTATTQTEAICFASNTELYVTDELVGGILGGTLYKIDLGTGTGSNDLPEPEGFDMYTYPNPFRDSVTITTGATETHGTVSLYSTTGKRVFHADASDGTVRISPSYTAVPPGVYLAVLNTADGIITARVMRQ